MSDNLLLLLYMAIGTYALAQLLVPVILISECEVSIPNSPNEIYKRYKVNRFGAYFLYILLFIGLPCAQIVMFIMWLCTVGREK